MRHWRLLLVGFGTVGQGVAERLRDSTAELAAAGIAPHIVGVLDPIHGNVGSENGLDPGVLVGLAESGNSLLEHPGAMELPSLGSALDELGVDILFEMTPTNLADGQPGLGHVRAALTAGVHVATTNKGPVALAWPELADLATAQEVQLRCEGTVMSGTPLLNLCETGLAGAGVRGVRGILNGTCNYILSAMEGGDEYTEALAAAQRLGYAETDPSGDVDGWDAAAKVTILGNLVLGGSLTLADVQRQGIAEVGAADVRAAVAAGRRLRLVGSVGGSDHADGLAPSVRIEDLPAQDPLASVAGAGNLLTFETDALGPVSVAGPGAGRAATGHALVADLLAIHRGAR